MITDFPDAAQTPAALSSLYHAAIGKQELLEQIPDICSYVLNNYQGVYKKSVYNHTLNIYLELAEVDLVSVSECESLFKDYYDEYGDEIPESEKAQLDERMNKLRQSKRDSLIKYTNIDDLPRMP